jgi:hypothetical protein
VLVLPVVLHERVLGPELGLGQALRQEAVATCPQEIGHQARERAAVLPEGEAALDADVPFLRE